MSHIEGFIDLEKTRVFHRCWLSDSASILVVGVHGFAEHSGRYTHIGEAFLESGYSFCIHDLRGHGRTATSDEERGYVDSFDDFLHDLRSYIAYLVDRYRPGRVALLGHSMGGLIVLHHLARVDENVDAAITSGAATIVSANALQLAFLKLMNALNPRLRIELPIRAEHLSHDSNVVRSYITDPLVVKKPTIRLVYELVRASKEIWRYIDRVDKPVMLLHGGRDVIVPPRASIEAYQRIRSRVKELKIYPDLYHEILNEPQWRTVFSNIVNWLQKTLEQIAAPQQEV